MKYYGGVEAGGTKFVCAIGDSEGKILERIRIPTTLPDETLGQVITFLKEMQKRYEISAIGVGTFGPLYLDKKSPYYGYIHAEQKHGWGNVNLLGIMGEAFPNIPIGYDTDVNTAAIGEGRWGNGKGFSDFVYWTIGTGIGAGVVSGGKIVHGLIHPEVGHTFVPQDKEKDPFPGVCAYHHNCLEGLASGPSMKARWNVSSAMDLPFDHFAWDLEAEYLGYAMANCIFNTSPQRIIIGGGVMKNKNLYAKVRAKVQEYLNGFIKHKAILEDIDNFIVPPALGDDAGVLGAIALAEQISGG
jgi:fructokinase